MRNWSTDEKSFKNDTRKHAIWRLEQIVNFGLGGDKIKIKELKKYWKAIKIDSMRRKFLSSFLHGK